MPKYKVTIDGKPYAVTVPEGQGEREAYSYARRMHGAAKPRRGGALGFLDNVVSSGNELLLGAGESVYNMASAITDPIIEGAANLISDGSGTRAVRGANRNRRKVVDTLERNFTPVPNPIARTAGRIAPTVFAPVPKIAAAGKLAAKTLPVVNRAIQGAIGGSGVREVDESALAPAATGAIANMVLPPVLSKVAQSRPVQALAHSLSRSAPAIADDAANVVDDVLGREAAVRQARFKAVGVEDPTTGMVTRNPAAFKTERKLALIEGEGDDLAAQIQGVEQSLVRSGRDLVNKMGGSKGAEQTGKAASEVLEAKNAEMRKVTSGLYKQAREARGDVEVGRLDSFREKISDPDLVDNPAFDQMREAVIKRLTRYGVIGQSGGVGRPATVKQAEELRKFIGGLGGYDPTAKMMRGKLIDALDDDVVASVGDDAFKAARESAKAGFAEFKKTVAGKIADEAIPAEKLTQRLLSMPLDDIKAVRRSFLTGTPEQVARGRAAWKDLQSQGVDDLLKSAITDEGAISGTKLINNFQSRSANLRILLDPADYKQLRRLVTASRDATVAPPSSSAYGSDTAPMLANLFMGAKAPIKDGWVKFLAKHGIVAAASAPAGAFPAANVALEVGQRAASAAAAQKAANTLAQEIQTARSPEAAAAAIRKAQEAAASNAAIADFLNKAGLGQLIGATAAAPTQ